MNNSKTSTFKKTFNRSKKNFKISLAKYYIYLIFLDVPVATFA